MNYPRLSTDPPQVMPDKLYSVHRAGRLLGAPGYPISTNTIYRWIRLGAIEPESDQSRGAQLSGREITRFWKKASTGIVYGQYPPWKGKFPDIDDVFDEILSEDTATQEPSASIEQEETGVNNPTVSLQSESATDSVTAIRNDAGESRMEAEPLRDLKETIRHLQKCKDCGSDSKVRIHTDILSTLRACDLGTTSLQKIVNAILLTFIRGNMDVLKRIQRRSLLDD